MSKPLLTIGMSTYDDYDGVFFSIQSLRMYHDICKNNNVEFNKNNKKINLLNGCVVTSGQEFFKSLGMKFEDTGEVHTEENI